MIKVINTIIKVILIKVFTINVIISKAIVIKAIITKDIIIKNNINIMSLITGHHQVLLLQVPAKSEQGEVN